jgi:hypothetical protein
MLLIGGCKAGDDRFYERYIRLAREVLAGARFASVKAVELAELLLAAARHERPAFASGA